ncbi:eukaryotic translation initiation factor 4E transporter-like isoform X2 [Mytilus californianus]|uniref:eukaryotic translation initiation factor 4E transporter-like isoform X2 n=1 Tax=Mytilus californianus TaxID=6549 RepID=UPI0022471EF2|nr:eukaryotic translation initiation factor 4E transporter-like isoform X2 [Mytilus californianus]
MEKEFNSDDSGRNTPREVVLTRSDTPGPTPTYIYSRDQLYEFSNSKTAKKRPVCLSTDYDNTEGLWDPEKWFRSFDSGVGDRLSPLNLGDKEKKADYLNKRRPSDPKERLKEEKDGIVLSPQRRSFGTGCHVTAPMMTRQVSCPADYKDDNRNVRRIGSGRIQIDRDRGEREREPQRERERDYRAIRDRFDDRDRRYDNRGDNRGYRREYDDRRDFSRHFSRDNGRNRHDSYRHREEEEPEWFSEGPTSQNDRIELHGFEGPREVKEEIVKGKDDEEEDNNMDTGFDEEYHEEAQQDESNKSSEVKVADVKERNGSLETNESSSPEESNNSGSLHVPSPQATNLFDFNEFFKIENLPGLNEGGSPTAEVQTGFQSRFSRWFSSHHGGGSMGNSRENSRRSSINEDFGYLNELLSGTKSPIVPSPPPNTINSMYDKSVFMTPGNSTFSDKPQCISMDMSVSQKNIIAPMLNSIFQNSGSSSHHKRNDSNSSNYSVQDVEAQLKALLFGRKDSTASSSGNNSPAVSSPRNVPYSIKTVQELEADMKPTTTPGHNYPQQPIPHPLAMNHHKIERQNRMTPPGVRMTPPTVIQHHQHQQHQQHQQPSSQHSSRRSSEDEGDLTAFNKLLSLMQAGAAAAVESPKIPTRQETRVPSPPQQMMQARPQTPNSQQTQAQIAQNEFLQALLRNKEQQNLIRQQALAQMKMSYMTKQSTPLAQPTPLGQQTPGGLRTTLPESLANYIKQNPTIITKSASPTPPPQTVPQQPQAPTMMNIIQNTSTPRAPSPTPQVIPNFMPQPTSSPRVPSPIMFSQQPPMHLNAPSPIHPSQLTSTSPINVPAVSMSSTASIRPPVVHRGPSPQELIAHTQAIMQTALLKKQLEDQKERFMKKQQERAKSPNPTATPNSSKSPSMMSMPMSNNPVIVNNQPKPAVSVAFTPTSVMRKMHSDKASEKDKQKPEMGEGTPAPPPPIRQLIRPDGSLNDEDHNSPNNEIDRHLNNKYQESRNGPHSQTEQQFNTHVPPPGYSGSMGSSTGNTEQGAGANKNARPGPNMMSNMMPANGPLPQMSGPPPLLSTQLSTPGRPIVKAVNVSTSSVTGVMTPNQVPIRQFSVSQQLNTPLSSASIQQRAIMGQNTLQTSTPNMPQRPINLSPNPLTRPIVGTPVSQNFSMGIPITGRMPIPPGGVNMTPSPLVLQQMMQGGISPATARVNALNQINQINHLNQMAIQAQQQQQRMMDPRLQAMGGPVSPGLYNGNNNLTKPGEPNLFKWFGNDVLKGQIPNMPPLPQQGTRVMTVDEIERC